MRCVSAEIHVDDDAFVDAVIVVQIVRRPLVEPSGVAGFRVAGEDSGGPFVVARALVGVPGAGIGGAVKDQVLLRVVGDPAPHGAAADLPGLGRPGMDTEILALVLVVERLELVADQHVLVGAGAVGAPGDLAGIRVERGQPAPHPQLAAAVPDQHLAADDQRRHRHRLAARDLAELRAPQFLAGIGVERHGLVIQGVEEDFAVGIGGAAIDHVAARDALRRRGRFGLELPLDGPARLGQVDRIDDVGVRRDDEHRVAGHDRRRFLALLDAERKCPGDLELLDVIRRDLGQAAEPEALVVFAGHDPLAVLRRLRRGAMRGGEGRRDQ